MVATTGMLTKEQVIQYVGQKAPQMGLDPAAVLAVAQKEGLNTQPGSKWWLPKESNWSFGPPSWYGNGAGNAILTMFGGNADAAAQWSWTPAGIDYWLTKIKASGASGLTGMAAISQIVNGFERPREDLAAGEITAAWALYPAFAQQVNVGGVVENPSTVGDSGAAIVTGPTTGQIGGGVTDTTPGPATIGGTVQVQPGMAGQIQLGLLGAFQGFVGKFGSGLILLLASLFAILIGAIIWNGEKVKKYAPDVAVAAATA